MRAGDSVYGIRGVSGAVMVRRPPTISGRPVKSEVGTGQSGRWAHPPAWLWPLSVAMQVGAALWLTGFTYFFQDDLLFLEQARTQRFDLTYLREGCSSTSRR